MEVNIFNYIEKDKYEEMCNKLKSNEMIKIYDDNHMDIEIKKVGKKVYTFINKYGDKKLNEVLNNICSLV
ncbi:hypothetical protein [Clostridium butyricum]